MPRIWGVNIVRGLSVLYLTRGGIMSHHYMSDGNDTFQESVAGTRGRAVRVWPPAP